MDEEEEYRRRLFTRLVENYDPDFPFWYDDPDYYAADRIKQKRRQKYSSSRPLTIVRDERRVVPPTTNGDVQ